MLSTPLLGLTYPQSGDHTRTWEYWQALAQQIEAKLTATTVAPGTPTAQTGWAVTTSGAIVRNGVISWAVQATRTGATITQGQIADSPMFQLPAAWRPSQLPGPGLVLPVFGWSNATVGYGQLSAVGMCTLCTQVGGDVISGNQYHVSGTHPIPTASWL